MEPSLGWIYGDLIQLSEVLPVIQRYEGQMLVGGEECKRFSQDKVHPETIGQFTGMKDINGREIYEGDIVRVRVTNDRFKKNPRFRNGVVKFCKHDGGWENGCYYRFIPERMEVIGNIFDHPERLEGGAQ